MQIVNNRNEQVFSKLPELSVLFWVMKITATTLGETGGDLLAQTLSFGYATSTIIFFVIFLVTAISQLSVKRYISPLYWAVIVATSTAGTTMSDFMDRTMGLGYTKGAMILISILIIILIIWRLIEKSLSVTNIRSFRGEAFYWTAILFSNTLGTALGDFLAEDSGLGFGRSALLITGVLIVVVLAYYFTKISRVILFWIAFILTRPFGATFGDLLTKSHEKSGLGYGTKGSSLILVSLLIALIIYETIKLKQYKLKKWNADNKDLQATVPK